MGWKDAEEEKNSLESPKEPPMKEDRKEAKLRTVSSKFEVQSPDLGQHLPILSSYSGW